MIPTSTIGTTVMLSMLALSFDGSVSFSVLFTTTAFEMFPREMTSATMVRISVEPLFILPIVHVKLS